MRNEEKNVTSFEDMIELSEHYYILKCSQNRKLLVNKISKIDSNGQP